MVVVTNQSGVARGYFTEEDVKKLHVWMGEEIKKAGGEITSFYYCPHLPGALLQEYDRECECRKPKPGMVKRALQEQQVLPENAFLIGDSPRDVEAAKRAGVKGYLFTGGDSRGIRPADTGGANQARRDLKLTNCLSVLRS